MPQNAMYSLEKKKKQQIYRILVSQHSWNSIFIFFLFNLQNMNAMCCVCSRPYYLDAKS